MKENNNYNSDSNDDINKNLNIDKAYNKNNIKNEENNIQKNNVHHKKKLPENENKKERRIKFQKMAFNIIIHREFNFRSTSFNNGNISNAI